MPDMPASKSSVLRPAPLVIDEATGQVVPDPQLGVNRALLLYVKEGRGWRLVRAHLWTAE